ncbi:MAG: phosphoribosylanthranilate isomerase [Hadesarchaea archaeon]|nr:phosphoribosylanthranilate isomerase [Hadesarchaea archaeon]
MVKVKICGLTRTQDVGIIRESGADMLGVIVNAKIPTPRNLDYEKAREILDKVPSGIKKVVVGMPKDLSEGIEIIDKLNPDYFQMHSYPNLSEVKELKKATGKKLILTISIPQEVSNENEIISSAKEVSKVSDFILLDTKGPAGGETGKVHDWSVSRKIREEISTPVFLAGGLTPSNVNKAIKKVQPYGVDVASGVESKPGIKNSKKVREFVNNSKERD